MTAKLDAQAQLLAHLADKAPLPVPGGDVACAVCRNMKWKIAEGVYDLPGIELTETGAFAMKRTGLPVIVAVCTECFHLRLWAHAPIRAAAAKKLRAETFAYDAVPTRYACARCKQHGCKLWRDATAAAAREVELLCADCAIVAMKKHDDAIGDMVPASGALELDADGTWTNVRGERSNRIAWLMPAVPTEDGLSYYNTSSLPAPDDAQAWWRRLPTRAPC